MGVKRETFASTIHPYGVPTKASKLPTKNTASAVPATSTRPTAYAASRENRRIVWYENGTFFSWRNHARRRTRTMRPPTQNATPTRCPASAKVLHGAHAVDAAA